MIGSMVVYAGLVLVFAGFVLALKPIHSLRIRKRSQGLTILGGGAILAATGFLLPAPESRIWRVELRLDEFLPEWQFHEFHSMKVAAPPALVYDAMKRVRADEIPLFRTLTWIRRGGRTLPRGILDAGDREPLIDVATSTDFVLLADDSALELVMGTVILAPPGAHGTLTPAAFKHPLPTGFVLAAMNFVVRSDGAGGSIVSTATRVFANSPDAKRRFAVYWRLIYPGSAIIRRMWLRAIERRATSSAPAPSSAGPALKPASSSTSPSGTTPR